MPDEPVRRLPDFNLPRLGGGRLSLAELRGNIIIINFWSAECPWSRRADVVLTYRHLTWERKGVRIVGIACNVNEPEQEIRAEAETRHIKYPILLDADQKIASLYHVETTPQFYIADRQGVLRYMGALDDASANRRRPRIIYVDHAVTALLNDKLPDPPVTSPYGCAIVRASDSMALHKA
jgi:peroxiredoxin